MYEVNAVDEKKGPTWQCSRSSTWGSIPHYSTTPRRRQPVSTYIHAQRPTLNISVKCFGFVLGSPSALLINMFKKLHESWHQYLVHIMAADGPPSRDRRRSMSDIKQTFVPQIDQLLVQHFRGNHTKGHRIPSRPQCTPVVWRGYAKRGK